MRTFFTQEGVYFGNHQRAAAAERTVLSENSDSSDKQTQT